MSKNPSINIYSRPPRKKTAVHKKRRNKKTNGWSFGLASFAVSSVRIWGQAFAEHFRKPGAMSMGSTASNEALVWWCPNWISHNKPPQKMKPHFNSEVGIKHQINPIPQSKVAKSLGHNQRVADNFPTSVCHDCHLSIVRSRSLGIRQDMPMHNTSLAAAESSETSSKDWPDQKETFP